MLTCQALALEDVHACSLYGVTLMHMAFVQVKVKRRGDDRKFLARVLSIGVDCDVALLKVDDPAFYEGFTPLNFGNLPKLQVGYESHGLPC